MQFSPFEIPIDRTTAPRLWCLVSSRLYTIFHITYELLYYIALFDEMFYDSVRVIPLIGKYLSDQLKTWFTYVLLINLNSVRCTAGFGIYQACKESKTMGVNSSIKKVIFCEILRIIDNCRMEGSQFYGQNLNHSLRITSVPLLLYP